MEVPDLFSEDTPEKPAVKSEPVALKKPDLEDSVPDLEFSPKKSVSPRGEKKSKSEIEVPELDFDTESGVPEADLDFDAKGALGGLEWLASMGSGAFMWIPTQLSKITGTVLYGSEVGDELERDIQKYTTYHPRSELGQELIRSTGEGMDKYLLPHSRYIRKKMHEVTTSVDPEKYPKTRRMFETAEVANEFLIDLITFKAIHAGYETAKTGVHKVKRYHDMKLPGERYRRSGGKSTAGSKPKLNKTNETPLEPNSEGTPGHEIEFDLLDRNGQNQGRASVEVYGDRAYLDWVESEGLGTRDMVSLSDQLASHLPFVEKIKGTRTKNGVSREIELDLQRKGLPRNHPIVKRLKRAAKNGLEIKNLKYDRYGDYHGHLIDSELFIADVTKDMSTLERQAAPFVIEETPVSELQMLADEGKISQGIVDTVKHQSPEYVKSIERIRDYYEKAHDFLKEYHDVVGYENNYVNRMWDLEHNQQVHMGSFFSTNNPQLEGRKIPSLSEGLQKGLRLKTTDIGELLKVYDHYRIKAAMNQRFADGIKEVKIDGAYQALYAGDKIPNELKGMYVRNPHPALKRTVYRGTEKAVKFKEGERVTTQKTTLELADAWVHKDIAAEVNAVLGESITGRAIGEYGERGWAAMQSINAYVKKGVLSASLFHHLALSEAALGHGIFLKGTGRALKGAMKDLASVIKEGKRATPWYMEEGNLPLVKDALRHGVGMNPLPDYHVTRVQERLDAYGRFLERKFGKAGLPMKAIAKANKAWDAFLWDHFHTTFKVMAYEKLVHQHMKPFVTGKKYASKADILVMKREIAQFVNDTFGGQVWELGKSSPAAQQLYQLALLSPDWTLSTIRQGTSPLRLNKPQVAKMGTKFWARMMMWYMLVNQSLNYYSSKKLYGEGRFTIDNPPGKRMDALLPYKIRDEEGNLKEVYLRTMKQVREVPELLPINIDAALGGRFELDIGQPLRKMGGKMHPVLSELGEQAFDASIGGFPAEWKRKPYESEAKLRLKSGLESITPFSARHLITDRPAPFALSVPASTGASKFSIKEELVKLLEAGHEVRRGKESQEIKQLREHALHNDVNWNEAVTNAEAEIKRGETYNFKKLATKARQIMMAEDVTSREAIDLIVSDYSLDRYGRQRVKELLKEMLANQRDIMRQKRRYGVVEILPTK